MNAVIVHGRPSKDQYDDPYFPSTSNYYWLPWLQKQLSLNNIPAETPEVPNAWDPHYPTWKATFEKQNINEESTLVGHSCGAGFIVRWLSENKYIMVKKVVLVAPWVDETGDPDNGNTKDFMNFTIDQNMVDRVRDLVIINSSNDVGTIKRSVETLRKEIKGVRYVELQDRGHFYDDSNNEMPELLEEILR